MEKKKLLEYDYRLLFMITFVLEFNTKCFLDIKKPFDLRRIFVRVNTTVKSDTLYTSTIFGEFLQKLEELQQCAT